MSSYFVVISITAEAGSQTGPAYTQAGFIDASDEADLFVKSVEAAKVRWAETYGMDMLAMVERFTVLSYTVRDGTVLPTERESKPLTAVMNKAAP